MISKELIEYSLNKDTFVEYKEVTSSTNDDVEKYIGNDDKKDFVVIAGLQTKGRGRLDHSFASPKGGLYFSILKNTKNLKSEDILLITPIVALSIYRAIKEVLHKETDIKWINDILYQNKKVCGILCEAKQSFEYVIIGIGIDYKLSLDELDVSLKEIVGTLSSENDIDLSNELIIATINNINELIDKLPNRSFLEEYRAHCITIGKSIAFNYNNERRKAKALDVLDDGSLQVQEGDRIYSLNVGEVSIIR